MVTAIPAGKRQPPVKPQRLSGPRAPTNFDQMLNDPKVQAQGIISNEHVRGAVWDDPDIPEGECPFLKQPKKPSEKHNINEKCV